MAAVNRWADATAALGAADPALAAAISILGPCRLVRGRAAGGAFGALARSICFQQLAGAAASAIHGRFAALYDGRPTPAAVAATPEEVLRGVGLSAAKVASIRDLAAKALDGTVRLEGWNRMDDDEIVDRLVTVRGIGPWTAQMFLIFQLNRPDVWPTGDLGVRVGYGRMHGLDVAPTPAGLAAAGEIYRPYRSIAAWYCWRTLDGPFT
ncbi:MAG: DNA-3-methyladenine glycosylase [Actinomycetota bacterium]|jgi:3-methyladenine DNA glycosylase/8-oxoguanine DNA glycosylase|nr:DNA-3-methyladenine glycosylase [Actinomycetota bacterium]